MSRRGGNAASSQNQRKGKVTSALAVFTEEGCSPESNIMAGSPGQEEVTAAMGMERRSKKIRSC